jgi:hypothetical protein
MSRTFCLLTALIALILAVGLFQWLPCGLPSSQARDPSPPRGQDNVAFGAQPTATAWPRETSSSGVWGDVTCFRRSGSESRLPPGTTLAGGGGVDTPRYSN